MKTVNRETVNKLPGMWIDVFRSRLCSDGYGIADIDLELGSEIVIRRCSDTQLNKLISLGVVDTE